jgi:hypothetical protein
MDQCSEISSEAIGSSHYVKFVKEPSVAESDGSKSDSATGGEAKEEATAGDDSTVEPIFLETTV